MNVEMNVKYSHGRYVARDPRDSIPVLVKSYSYNPKPDAEAKKIFSALWKIYSELKDADGKLLPFESVCTFVYNHVAFDPEIPMHVKEWFLDESWISAQMKRMIALGVARLRRVQQKCGFADFNYFCTFTYDDNKCTEEEFRRGLKKALENATQRKGWTYLAVWQNGEEGGRLHLHALVRVPGGILAGSEMYSRLQWSAKRHKREAILSNRDFDRFGNNDFRMIQNGTCEYDHAVNYISRYMTRGNEPCIFSRHLMNSVPMMVDTEKDVLYVRNNFGKEYVLRPSFMWSISQTEDFDSSADVFGFVPETKIDWFFVDPEVIHTFSEILEFVSNQF